VLITNETMCVSTSCYCGKDLGNKAVVVIVLEIMVHLMNRQYLNFIKGKIIQLRVKYTYALEGGEVEGQIHKEVIWKILEELLFLGCH